MSDPLTEDQLAELERLSREATPGKWESSYCAKCDGWHLEGPEHVGGTGILIKLRDSHEQIGDLQLIVAMRNTIDALIAEVRQARAREAALKQLHLTSGVVAK